MQLLNKHDEYPTTDVGILPCPFCGATINSLNKDTGQPNLEIWEVGDTDEDYCIICNNCEARGPLRSGEYFAIIDWNRRGL